jgi:hypothetical protein
LSGFSLNAFITWIFTLLADAGTVVDVNVAEKLAQLKNQVATLEKREER